MKYIIREKFWHVGEDSDILNENQQPVYEVDGKVLSINNLLIVKDLSGAEVARVHRKLISLVPTFEISVGGQDVGEVRKHFFTPLRQKFSITLPGEELEMEGDLLNHECSIEKGQTTVATVSKRWITLTATYGVDIAEGENDVLILASVLALDLALDQERQTTAL